MGFTLGINPALDHLQALQWCAQRIGGRHYKEIRCADVISRQLDVSPHGYAIFISSFDTIDRIKHALVQVSARKKSNFDARARGRKHFFPPKSVIQ